MSVYEYITLSVEVASVVEPKVHLASIPLIEVSREQEREPLVPFNTLIVPLGLSIGSSNTKTTSDTKLMSKETRSGKTYLTH